MKKTGRKTLIIAATVTSVCLVFPAIAAVQDGYRVFVVPDASGTYSKMTEEVSLARMVQAGCVPIDTAGVLAELQHTWHRLQEEQLKWAKVWSRIFVNYGLLLESYAKHQHVFATGEIPDADRED